MQIKIEGQVLNSENFTKLINPKRLSRVQLLSILGQAKKAQKFYEKVEGYTKEIFTAQFDDDEFEFNTDHWAAIRVERERTALDQDAVREEMGEQWFNAHKTTTSYYVLSVKYIGPEGEEFEDE